MDFKVFYSSSRFSGTLLPDEAPGENTSSINVSSHIFEGLCIRFVIVIQYEKSILYTYDTFSEISHFLFEVLFARLSLQVLLYQSLYLSALSFWWRFSDWHLINVSLLKFAFSLQTGSGSFRFSSFPNDCSVILYSYPCIRSFLQEIRFLSLPHIDGCYTTFPMDSPYPFDLFHPFHVAFIYTMNWMIFFCISLVFFWWVYNSTRSFICQHFFDIFSIFLLYYIYIFALICYLF